MTALQIRDVPPDVRDALSARAQSKGQSLSAFLRDVVIREAKFGENIRLIDDIANWPGAGEFTVDDVIDAIESDRAAAR